jgi:hypothetical protein
MEAYNEEDRCQGRAVGYIIRKLPAVRRPYSGWQWVNERWEGTEHATDGESGGSGS